MRSRFVFYDGGAECGGSLAPSLRGLAAKQTGGVWFLRRTLPPTSLRSATSL